MESLSPLRDARRLIKISFTNNQVDDLTHLADLAQLQDLVAINNRVRNIDTLLGMAGLRFVALTNNPLSATARNVRVPALRDRGLNVRL